MVVSRFMVVGRPEGNGDGRRDSGRSSAIVPSAPPSADLDQYESALITSFWAIEPMAQNGT
jgi:hypothetical protein